MVEETRVPLGEPPTLPKSLAVFLFYLNVFNSKTIVLAKCSINSEPIKAQSSLQKNFLKSSYFKVINLGIRQISKNF